MKPMFVVVLVAVAIGVAGLLLLGALTLALDE